MSDVIIKTEPKDFEETLHSDSLTQTRKRSADDVSTARRGEREKPNKQHIPNSYKEQYLGRNQNCDVMPTLIPIHNSRGFGSADLPPQKQSIYGQKQAVRSASDTDVDLMFHATSHPDVFTCGGNHTAIAEVNRKLSTLIANQNKLMAQNEMILSKLNSRFGSKSHRIEQLDNILQGKQRNQPVRNDVTDDRQGRAREMPINFRNGRHSSSSFVSSEGGSIISHSEAELSQPSQVKSHRTSDGMSSVGSMRSVSKSPSRDTLLVPSMVPICNSQASSANAISSPGNAMPMQQQGALPLNASPYNMAVYVLRAGEHPQMVPVLPVQYSKQNQGALQSEINSSMLSSHPALIFNPETRQYEASYVTGIAHTSTGSLVENTDAAQKKRDTTWKGGPNVSSKGESHVIGETSLHMQPNITNIVSLRTGSADAQSQILNSSSEERGKEDGNEGRGSSVSASVNETACSTPASPIVIEEDVKPTNLPSQEELMHAQLRSFSMRNYAVQLMRALFRPHEIMHRCVYENGERKGVDRKRLQQIKDYVFQIYPTPNKEKSLAWIECIAAMNEAIRSMK